jgi:hypothetical protein
LAAITIDGLAEWRYPRLAAGIAAVTFAYAIAMLCLYFTVMHGDRPRWAEATELLKQYVDVRSASITPVYATEPGVVAHYLGVPANETMRSDVVKQAPSKPIASEAKSSWYLVDSARISNPLRSWLNNHGERLGTFEARTGPRDRTVWLYRVDNNGEVR